MDRRHQPKRSRNDNMDNDDGDDDDEYGIAALTGRDSNQRARPRLLCPRPHLLFAGAADQGLDELG